MIANLFKDVTIETLTEARGSALVAVAISLVTVLGLSIVIAMFPEVAEEIVKNVGDAASE